MSNKTRVKKYKQSEKGRRTARLRNLSKYGLTEDSYNALLNSQNNSCAICSNIFTGKSYVDHDHKTGYVRGILCLQCNTSLGNFKDDIFLLWKAMSYLIKSDMIQKGEI